MFNVKEGGSKIGVQNGIAEIKIRCERRIGEFSRELPTMQLSGLKHVSSSHRGKTTKTQVLSDAGIAINHANHYEYIAELEE